MLVMTNKPIMHQMEVLTMKLLNTTGGNTKIAKSSKSKLGTENVRIASLSLMPDDILCPARHLAGCAAPCLQSAGRGRMSNVAQGRQRKTDYWHADRDKFIEQLRAEKHSFIRTCLRQGVKPVFRLNTISDIAWETYLDLAGEFSDAYFYDYTKRAKRLGNTPENYDLMFSFSTTNMYRNQVMKALKTRVPMAVVGHCEMPKTFLGRPCIDGDASDIVNVQSGEVVIWLRAKGQAKYDESGFVVRDPELIERGYGIDLIAVA